MNPKKGRGLPLHDNMRTLQLLVLITMIGACKSKHEPADATIIPIDTLVTLLAEIQLIEAANAIHIMQSKDPKKMAAAHYVGLFQRYGISQQRFETSMHHYNNNPELLEEIYGSVIEELSKKQAEEAN